MTNSGQPLSVKFDKNRYASHYPESDSELAFEVSEWLQKSDLSYAGAIVTEDDFHQFLVPFERDKTSWALFMKMPASVQMKIMLIQSSLWDPSPDEINQLLIVLERLDRPDLSWDLYYAEPRFSAFFVSPSRYSSVDLRRDAKEVVAFMYNEDMRENANLCVYTTITGLVILYGVQRVLTVLKSLKDEGIPSANVNLVSVVEHWEELNHMPMSWIAELHGATPFHAA